MRFRKFLLVPGNNSLSHMAKCLAIRESLMARGHEARIAVNKKHSVFLRSISIEHAVLPDIQENDDSGFPSVEWFRQPKHIIDCIRAETELLREYSPDRVLGVFRFTLKSSARIAGVPYDSLVCGCMMPDSEAVLGFADGEPGREMQRIILDGFFRYAGSKIGAAAASFGLEKTNGDIRNMLKGERTFLWDFPEFTPLPQKANIVHVGPLSWNRWPYDPVDLESVIHGGQPLAVLAFGTCSVCPAAAERIIKVLLQMGYRVLLAAGGQKQFLTIMPREPRVIAQMFAPLHKILPHASLLVTHGGQLTVFEALQNRVPVIVMPFQPEQANNGVCLERLGCGVRLIRSNPFQGNSDVYTDALDQMTDAEIRSKISSLVDSPGLSARLTGARDNMKRYGGVEQLTAMLEEF